MSALPPAPAPASRSHIRALLRVGLVLVALAYLLPRILALGGDVDLSAWSLADLGLALVGATLAAVVRAAYHVIAVRRVEPGAGPAATIAREFLVAQAIRYIPGSIFGVVYQASSLAGIASTRAIVTANIVQMVQTNFLSAGLVLAALTAIFASRTGGIAIAVAAVAASWAGHAWHLAERGIAWLGARLRVATFDDVVVRMGRRRALVATLVLLLEWLPYFLCWLALAPPGDGLHAALLLAVAYAAAAMLANFAIVVPSGLVLREALFAWLGGALGLDLATLVALGIAARLVFTLADVAAVPLVLLARKGQA